MYFTNVTLKKKSTYENKVLFHRAAPRTVIQTEYSTVTYGNARNLCKLMENYNLSQFNIFYYDYRTQQKSP